MKKILFSNGRKKMFGNIMIFIVGILMISLTGCDLKTPEIRGVVLDAETKQPVEGAWIQATLQINSKTIQGDVSTVIRVEPPHTRSNQKGEFFIPAKEFKKPSFPTSFGTEIENFSGNASTIDDKSGGFYLKEYKGKKKIDVVIHVKPWEKGITDEREYFPYLQSLYNYCFHGRFGVEVPIVEGGCDKWELGFAITKHEKYFKRHPKTEETRSHNSIIFEQLGLLYEKKGDYEKAIMNLKKAREIRFFRPQDLDNEIKRIQQKKQPK